MSDETKDNEATPLDIAAVVEKQKELHEEQVDRFDALLLDASESDLLQEFVEGYLQLRESGFDFDDAANTAAEQLGIEEDETELKDE